MFVLYAFGVCFCVIGIVVCVCIVLCVSVCILCVCLWYIWCVCLCECVDCVCGDICTSACIEIRGQPRADSLLPHVCGFQGSNLGCQACPQPLLPTVPSGSPTNGKVLRLKRSLVL